MGGIFLKRITSLFLVVVLLMTSSISYGTIAEKLENHWANSVISRTFVAYYFPYLAKENFSKFEPSGNITEQEFTLSIASLFKDYDYDTLVSGSFRNISRVEMVNNLGSKLAEIGLEYDKDLDIPFKDVNNLSSDSIELLRILNYHGIILGDNNSTFSPDRKLSQVEAIVILQRSKEVLEKMNTVDFKTLGIVQSYNSQEEIIIKEEDNKVLVTITKQFPTPGYSMSVNKIKKDRDGYRVYFNITPPKSDSIQLQVITYKTLTMEINKNLLNGQPYNFILDGYNKVSRN